MRRCTVLGSWRCWWPWLCRPRCRVVRPARSGRFAGDAHDAQPPGPRLGSRPGGASGTTSIAARPRTSTRRRHVDRSHRRRLLRQSGVDARHDVLVPSGRGVGRKAGPTQRGGLRHHASQRPGPGRRRIAARGRGRRLPDHLGRQTWWRDHSDQPIRRPELGGRAGHRTGRPSRHGSALQHPGQRRPQLPPGPSDRATFARSRTPRRDRLRGPVEPADRGRPGVGLENRADLPGVQGGRPVLRPGNQSARKGRRRWRSAAPRWESAWTRRSRLRNSTGGTTRVPVGN